MKYRWLRDACSSGPYPTQEAARLAAWAHYRGTREYRLEEELDAAWSAIAAGGHDPVDGTLHKAVGQLVAVADGRSYRAGERQAKADAAAEIAELKERLQVAERERDTAEEYLCCGVMCPECKRTLELSPASGEWECCGDGCCDAGPWTTRQLVSRECYHDDQA